MPKASPHLRIVHAGPALAAAATLVGALVTLGVAAAQTPSRVDEGAPPTLNDETALALARAFDERLTVWRGRDGSRVHARHCRSARGGCRARIAHYARLIAEMARQADVDPFLVAAIVLRESGLNPFAEGTAGERGIVQLHPRGVGRDVEFVQNESYRRGCRDRADACQREVLRTGITLLAASIERCGSVEAGLGMYNSGQCQVTSYSRRVLAERARLLELAKRDEPDDHATNSH